MTLPPFRRAVAERAAVDRLRVARWRNRLQEAQKPISQHAPETASLPLGPQPRQGDLEAKAESAEARNESAHVAGRQEAEVLPIDARRQEERCQQRRMVAVENDRRRTKRLLMGLGDAAFPREGEGVQRPPTAGMKTLLRDRSIEQLGRMGEESAHRIETLQDRRENAKHAGAPPRLVVRINDGSGVFVRVHTTKLVKRRTERNPNAIAVMEHRHIAPRRGRMKPFPRFSGCPLYSIAEAKA
jgi:hypothetical protein